MSQDTSLLGGLAEPYGSLGIIPFYPHAVLIHNPEVLLGLSVTLICRLAVPRLSLGIVARYS